MHLAHPRNLVVAEDVSAGKPGGIFRARKERDRDADLVADPECYKLGKQRLGLSAEADVLVIEDSPAGIRAGKAAGCRVLGLATTHNIAQLKANSPTWIVEDLRSVRFIGEGPAVGQWTMKISGSLTA